MENKKLSERISILAKKWNEGTITPEEKKEFDEWYSSFKDTSVEFQTEEDYHLVKERIFHSIDREITPPYKKHFFQTPAFRVAVAVALLVTPIWLYFKEASNETAALVSISKNDIPPGGQKAVLILSDGSKVILDETASSAPVNIEGAEINRKLGKLVYTSDPSEKTILPVYHTIQIPRGGTYQLNLPDGTKVWLNAASSLRYPVEFGSDIREVELTGEGYFEVAKDKKRPFIVKNEKLNVEVLGTHFNINAYQDESRIKTTLFEGKVRIHQADKKVDLEPMQQAVLNASTQAIKIKGVDSREAIAWKNGEFIFDNELITSVMRKISRWYDVEVVYEGQIPKYRYIGKISRYENVSEVLKMLSLTKTIHFKVDERRISVMF